MKQQKNTNSERTTTVTCLLRLLILILISSVISGGDSFAAERNIYKVIVARPGNNITTQMRVYAENEEEARENVALNGWQILSIELSNSASTALRGAEGTAAAHLLSISVVGQGELEPMGDVSVQPGDSLMLNIKPGACEKLGKLIHDGSEVMVNGDSHTFEEIVKDGYIVAVFEKNGSACGDNGIFSENLKEVGAIYFSLGKYTKELTEDETKIIGSVLQGKKYVVIGHTDDVKVVPNKEFSNNFHLSVKRAEYVRELITGESIDSESVKIIGLGPAFPDAENKKGGQPLNRRAVLYERRD